jgi:hypothetical protein
LRKSFLTISVATALLGLPDAVLADGVADLLNGKRITVKVECEDADPATILLYLDGAGSAVLRGLSYKDIPMINGRFDNEDFSVRASAAANRIDVVMRHLHVPGASTTISVGVSANSCTASYANDGGPLDTSCAANSCSLTPVALRKPTITTPEANTPVPKTPAIKVPDSKTPTVTIPQAPTVNTPSQKAPTVNTPVPQTPSLNAPAPKMPTTNTPTTPSR